MALVWRLILFFQIGGGLRALPNTGAKPSMINENAARKGVLEWVSGKVKKNVENFTTSWVDGTAMAALVATLGAGDTSKEAEKARLGAAIAAAAKIGISSLLDPVAWLSSPDDKCMLAYVSAMKVWAEKNLGLAANSHIVGAEGAIAGTTHTCQLLCLNTEGERITRGGQHVTASLAAPDGACIAVEVIDLKNGVYTLHFTLSSPGTYRLVVALDGEPLAQLRKAPNSGSLPVVATLPAKPQAAPAVAPPPPPPRKCERCVQLEGEIKLLHTELAKAQDEVKALKQQVEDDKKKREETDQEEDKEGSPAAMLGHHALRKSLDFQLGAGNSLRTRSGSVPTGDMESPLSASVLHNLRVAVEQGTQTALNMLSQANKRASQWEATCLSLRERVKELELEKAVALAKTKAE